MIEADPHRRDATPLISPDQDAPGGRGPSRADRMGGQMVFDLPPKLMQALASLQARIPRLMLAQSLNPQGSADIDATVKRLVWRISRYVDLAGRGLSRSESDGAAGELELSVDRLMSDTQGLIDALDAFVERPDDAPARAHLEALVRELPFSGPETAVAPGRLADRTRSDSLGSNSVGSGRPGPAPRDSYAETPRPIVELHRLDEAERDWWSRHFRRLTRRVNLGLLLILSIGGGLLALEVSDSRLPTRLGLDRGDPASTETHLPPGAALPRAARQAIEQGVEPTVEMARLSALLRHLGVSGDGLSALLEGWASGPAKTILELQARVLELEAEVIRLSARLETLDAALARTAPTRRSGFENQLDASGGTPTLQSVLDRPAVADTPVPPMQLGETLVLDEARRGIQLAALRREEGALAFAERTGLSPDRLFIAPSEGWFTVVLGWFEDASGAREALAGLSPSLLRQGPMVRVLELGSVLSRLRYDEPEASPSP